MPRNSSGTYSLYTPGNPVVSSTVISSTWANNTLADLAAALTDSLSRTGDGGMQAPLELTNGAIGAPALTWASETTSGWYRAAAGDFRFSVGGTDEFTITGSLVSTAGNFTVGGGALIGAATGGNQGTGTINATGVYDDGVLLVNSSGANPTGTVGLTAVNGAATTFLRSDGAPALSQAIVPTWTGTHIFNGATDVAVATSGVSIGKLSTNDATLSMTNMGQSANGRLWQIRSNGSTLLHRAVSDNSATNADYLVVTRSGAAIAALEFGNATNNPTFAFLGTGATTFGGDVTMTVGGTGYPVGYRGMPSRTTSGNDSTAATDNGRAVTYTGTGGHTFTVDSDFGTASNIMVLINAGSASLAVAESLSGTLSWFGGAGSVSTGSRTLAAGGVATIWMLDANNAYIWGIGVS